VSLPDNPYHGQVASRTIPPQPARVERAKWCEPCHVWLWERGDGKFYHPPRGRHKQACRRAKQDDSTASSQLKEE
jgi:hypothetical protein